METPSGMKVKGPARISRVELGRDSTEERFGRLFEKAGIERPIGDSGNAVLWP